MKKAERPPAPPAAPTPSKGPFGHLVDALVTYVAPHKHGHDSTDPLGPNIVTHERVLGNFTVPTPFGTFNANPSELHQIRPQRGGGTELIQVVDPDGSSGLELVFWRMPLIKGWRIELQGLGVYGGPAGTPVPLGARFVGIGLTKDWVDEKAHEAVSVTAELKLTDQDVARLAGLVAPGVGQATAEILAGSAESSIAALVGEALAGAVPIVSGLIALSTARWALRQVRNPKLATADKLLAVGHAIADAVRVVLPMTGVIANVALVGAAIGLKWLRAHRRPREAQATAPPTPGAAESKR
ncbi:MAG: hypothetical protein IT384_34455 [Deltaproteobacteria bacterium]|nr:hypothetical protein [Deltaproteobacteria bacterium]